jgi:radical SAM-linked protein
VRAKFRLRFRKCGDLRLLSHHDLMRTFERMLRRAGLPFCSSEGFHPKPRLVFALSLPLGVAGLQEVAELELSGTIPPEEVRRRLAEQAPPGLEILSVEPISARTTGHPRRLGYRAPLPPGRAEGLLGRIAAVMAAAECWVERTRPQRKQINLRPFLDQIRITDAALEVDLWVKPSGTARPEEVLGLLGLSDVLASGAVIERYRLELEDEQPLPHPPASAPEGE